MALFPHKPEDAINAAIEILIVLKEYNNELTKAENGKRDQKNQ